MEFSPIAPNLWIGNSPEFGNYNHDIVYNLLKSIDINFSSCLEVAPFSTCECYIMYHPDFPMCSKIENRHIIFLNTSDNYWSQWTYQFSHEYCHHLINRDMSGEFKGLKWFEETICELSSMYHLHRLHEQWINSANPIQCCYAPYLKDYKDNLLSKHSQLFSATSHPGFLQSWLPILNEPTYHRDYYNTLAAKMFPLFVENPFLWKIILHFGDTCKWSSLNELFEHLHVQADNSYAYSLKNLNNLLLS